VHGLADPWPWGVGAGVADVETAQAGQEFRPVSGQRAVRISGGTAHGGCEEGGVAAAVLGAPSFGAGGEDVGEVRLCGTRQAEARHAVSAVFR